MDRKTINTGAGIIGLFSLVAFVLSAIFKAIGWIEWAQGMDEVFALFADPRIHWRGIYLFLIFASAGVLIANNWTFLIRWKKARRMANVRNWNMSAVEAANFLATNARIASSFTYATRFEEAVEALGDAALHGQLAMAGRPPNSGLLVQLTKADWGRGRLLYRISDDMYERLNIAEICLSEKDSDTILFRGLMVDAREFGNKFP